MMVGLRGYTSVGLLDCWVYDCQTIVLSDFWAVGLLGCRTVGLSDCWAVRLFGI